jgi:putative protein-disulfide isomerase
MSAKDQSGKKKLYYVYDPMCSWCWGYKPTWNQIEKTLKDKVEIVYLLGGLAPDSDEPMPPAMQQQIASYWKKIEGYLGTQFNYDFWDKNTPRRSTYPACRALLAARSQGAEHTMLTAIQTAYYLEAKNPSDNLILIDLAKSIGLNEKQFETQFLAEQTQQELLNELNFVRSIGGNSFPSLFIETSQGIAELPVNYQDAQVTINQVTQAISN